jgi:nucleoside-diphosphate-sugar epimerase
VHCAALSQPFGRRADFLATNVGGTRAVLDLATRLGVGRFVHISSPSVYFALRDHMDQREDQPLPPPFNAYAETKAMAEALVLAAPHLGPVILRPRGIYGAGDRSLLPRLLRAARSGPLPLFRQGAARIDLTHVDDVVAAILAALTVGAEAEGQTFNISGGEVLPIRQIAEAACACAGLVPRWRRLPLRPVLWAAGLAEVAALCLPSQPEPPVTRYGLGLFAYAQSLNLAKANRLLTWSPQVPFAEGVARSVAP